MSGHTAMTAILHGGAAAAFLIGLWVVADAVLLVLGYRHSLAQIITHAWRTRPQRAHSRTRRIRPQGPGN